MLKKRARHLRSAVVCLVLFAAALPAHAATTLSDLVADDVEPTLSGSYLSALSAIRNQDLDAATLFFEDALSQDPQNPLLLERTFTLLIESGKADDAMPLAERLVAGNDGNRMGQLALGVKALKDKNYRESAERLSKGDRGELANIVASLLAAWAAEGSGQTDAALKIIETTSGPDWYGTFRDFNTALIDDLAGRHDEAAAAIAKAYQSNPSSMRIVEAYARLMARAGKFDEAKKAVDTFSRTSAGQPWLKPLIDDVNAGRKPAPLIVNAQQGAAEVLYGLGAALGSEKGGEELGTVYLQLALYLQPHADLVTMALGDLMQSGQHYERSTEIFGTVPKSSPLRRAADLQIATNLASMDKTDESTRLLKRMIATNAKDFEALNALGNIYRSDKKFLEAADAYSKAIDAIDPNDPRRWLLYYFRGTAYERAGQWPKAETDFLKALDISPNEPQVLNYLGYMWVDKGVNLDRGMDMIKKAVDLKPDDGYIVDSLGWAYYRQNRFEEAVGQLERAISLKPDDVTVNDHLGDAYWKVGRKLEATFQWAHARDLNPEPEDKPRILAKLAKGLDKYEESQVASATGNTVTDATVGAAATAPKSVTVERGDSLWKIALKLYGNGELYTKLIEANRAKLGHPDHIVPGQVIEVPSADKAP